MFPLKIQKKKFIESTMKLQFEGDKRWKWLWGIDIYVCDIFFKIIFNDNRFYNTEQYIDTIQYLQYYLLSLITIQYIT